MTCGPFRTFKGLTRILKLLQTRQGVNDPTQLYCLMKSMVAKNSGIPYFQILSSIQLIIFVLDGVWV